MGAAICSYVMIKNNVSETTHSSIVTYKLIIDAAVFKGKPLVDANFGEVLVTCEKITWLLKEGEKWLKPESRSTSSMMFYKKARVEYVPVRILLLAHAPPNSK